MEVVITDPDMASRLIAQRQEWGADRFDEVWDGTYVVAPSADNVHQDIQAELGVNLYTIVGVQRPPYVYLGVNVSDRVEGWEHNYRCPDIAVYLANTTARECWTHWCGGPDFAVEIRSRGDRTLQKLPFYASVNTRELLVIDRDPWSLDLYRLRDGKLASCGKLDAGATDLLPSEVLPLSFRLIAGSPRPIIEVRHRETGQVWSA